MLTSGHPWSTPANGDSCQWHHLVKNLVDAVGGGVFTNVSNIYSNIVLNRVMREVLL